MFGILIWDCYRESFLCTIVLVLGVDTLTRWVDWEDRNLCILFGAHSTKRETIDLVVIYSYTKPIFKLCKQGPVGYSQGEGDNKLVYIWEYVCGEYPVGSKTNILLHQRL